MMFFYSDSRSDASLWSAMLEKGGAKPRHLRKTVMNKWQDRKTFLRVNAEGLHVLDVGSTTPSCKGIVTMHVKSRKLIFRPF